MVKGCIVGNEIDSQCAFSLNTGEVEKKCMISVLKVGTEQFHHGEIWKGFIGNCGILSNTINNEICSDV